VKILSRLLLSVIPLLILSCGEEKSESSEGFSVNLPGEAVIIPSDSKSCSFFSDNDLDESYFKIRSATISWERTDQELILSSLRVEVSSSALDNDFSEIMDGSDIADFFVIQTSTGTTTIQNGTVPPNSILVLRSGCSLAFGGLQVRQDSPSFTAEAVVTLQGVAVGTTAGEDGNLGVEASVRAKGRIRLNYSN